MRARTLFTALAAAAILFVLFLHLPFVRGALLGYLIPRIEREYQFHLTASRLDYNLAAMRIGLGDVRLATPRTPDEPFFVADYVLVDVPWSILRDALVFDDISVTNGGVVIRRHADGTTNLPAGSGEPGGEPAPLRINRLDINRLSVDVNDEQAVTSLWLPAIAVRLTPAGGSLRMETAGFVRTETQETAIQRIGGDASFDGRALRLSSLDIVTADASARISGAVTVIAESPSVDLTIAGSADLMRVSRWFITDGELPAGTVTFDAAVGGPFTDVATAASVRSDRLTWGDVAVTAVNGEVRITSTSADVARLVFGFAGGTVSAMGVLPLDDAGAGRVSGSWTGIDAAAATRMVARDAGLTPSGVFSGEIDLAGTGVAPAQWRGVVRIALAGGTARDGQLPAPGSAMVRLNEGRWRLEGRHAIGGVAPAGVVLSGTTGDTIVTGDIDLSPSNLVALADVLRASGLADVSPDAVTGGSIEGTLHVAGPIADPVLTGEIAVRDLTAPDVAIPLVTASVHGRPAVPDIAFSADAPGGEVAGEAVANVRAAGRLLESTVRLQELSAAQPSTAGTLTAQGTYGIDSGRYDVTVDGIGWRISPTADRPAAADVDLAFKGTGTVDDPAGAGTMALRGAEWDGTRLGDVTASLALARRSVVMKAEAPEFAATANLQVALDPPYAATVEARATGLDLARLLEGVETPVPVSGMATLALRAEGPLETWRSGAATIEVTSLDASAGDLNVRLAETARARYSAERVFIDRLEVDAEDLRLSATGDLTAFEGGAPGSGLLVTMTGNVDQVVRAAAAAGLTDLPVAGGSGPVALLARVTGAVDAPVVAADLEVGPGTVTLTDFPPASNIRLRAHAEEGWVELREAQVTYEGAEVTATGRAPLSLFTDVRRAAPAAPTDPGGAGPAGSAELHARATNLSPALLRPFVEPGTLDDVEGSIDATLDLSAPALELAGLTGELRIDRLDVRVADLPVTQRVPTRIVARDGFARVEAWEWAGQGATLDVRGQMRLENRQTAILANGVVDLRMLTPFVRDAGMATAGRMEPRLSITGPIDSLRIDGDVLVSDGEVRLMDPRVVVSGLTIRTVLSRMSGRVTELNGSINGGTFTGGGTIDYTDTGQIDLQLSSDISGMALEFPEGLRSEVDAALELAIVAPNPMAGRLSGTVTVVRGSYREPLAVVTGLLAASRAQQLAAATEASPLLDALALDVRVVTNEDIFVDNNYGRFQLGGDLRLIGTASAPALSGRAELREGGQLFVGRNVYTVNFGAIDFASAAAIEPNLNVEAATRAGGEDIDVAITGPAESPTVTLSSASNPDLGQAELASLLLTGRRLEDLAPGDAAFVGTQVLGNFSAEVLGFASRAVGLDTLRLGGVDNPTQRRDPTAVATELDPTTRVTFGKSLGSDVDVTFSQSLRDSDAQTWIVDYLPARGLELRLVSDDEDLRSYGFRHDVAFGGTPRAGQAATIARADTRVTRIDITGEVALPEARVRDVLRLAPGDRFDFARWQEDRDQVESLYREERYLTARINAQRMDEADGVVLVYAIQAGPVTSIDITGIQATSALRERLEMVWAQSVFDDFLIDEAAGVVREALAADGYLQPTVNAAVREAAGTKVLAIDVMPGERTTDTRVRIQGADETLSAEIQTHLELSGAAGSAVSDPGQVEAAATTFLRSRGHLRASVTAGAPLFGERTAILPLTVDAGDVFVVSEVSFPGAGGLDIDLRGVAGVDPGEPYVATAIEEARQRLVAVYRREGFAAAAVAVRPGVNDTRPEVAVAFEVTEGPRQVLTEIAITGNRRVATDVIRRTLDVSEGAPLRADQVLQARTRVFNTGLFRRIDVASEPSSTATADASTTAMRLRVTVEEWPAVRLRYGLVVAEERPEDKIDGRELVPGVSADVTRRMLFGRPIGIGTAVSLQRRDQRGRVFANTPTFFGLPVESSLIAERSREQFQAVSLVTNRDSVTWEQRARPARNLTFSYAYTYERNHTFDTDPNEGDEFAFDITVNIARVNGAVAWDTRDDPTDTTRGLFASATTEYAPEAVGSDIRFIRQLQQGYYFRPWRGMVFASAARAGVVVPLGGQELIVSERFFGGGSRTVRGVAEEGLGGRDFFGDPTGGQLMIVLNQEVRVPIYRWVGGVGFVDAGNVFTRPRDGSLRDLVGSVGVGLRLATPFALLRVDFAKTAWGAPATSGRWSFGIGQAF